MRLGARRELDALCGEYLLGTLRGSARDRFERAVREESAVALRLRFWEQTFALTPAEEGAIEPSASVWKRLARELDLGRYRTPWHRRLAFWRAATAGAAAALVVALSLPPLLRDEAPTVAPLAQLEGKAGPLVTALASADRSVLHLQPARPVVAGPAQSYELWLIPAEGGAPMSLAVLGDLAARVPVAPDHARRLVAGAKLAISVEPAGGSPTGGPTGPVIMAGQIGT